MSEKPTARMLLQYLEPSAAVDRADPIRLRIDLALALERLPVTDLALGWRLRPDAIDAVTSVIPDRVDVWRWVPMFVDAGSGGGTDTLLAVGPDGLAPPPFHGLDDFRFLCLDRDEVVEASLTRAVALGRETAADGVLLDRIRWHSPSQSPTTELTCFCPTSRRRATADGLDLAVVATGITQLGQSLEGRRSLVRALLGGGATGVIADFLEWRGQRVSTEVERLAMGLREAGLRSALDVFTPALAGSVGQDLRSLSRLGEWAKSMTYFDALGPASMPFELRGYGAWLEAAGDSDAPGFLRDVLGFEAPGVTGQGTQLEALRHEIERLSQAVGSDRSVVGIDAVEIPGVCEVDDADLEARVGAIREARVGLAPSWELLFMDDSRIGRLAAAWTG